MTQILLQPCGDRDAIKNFENTIRRSVPLSEILPLVTDVERERLIADYPSGFARVWGVVPGKKDVNVGKWAKVRRGDVMLASRDGHFFASAVVTSTLHNARVAELLWGFKTEGVTWEYIYFLDEVENRSIPYRAFNEAVGYAENFVPQGFNVLDAEKSEVAVEFLGLASEVILPAVPRTRLLGRKDLDAPGKTTARMEQGYLRELLFQRRSHGTCSLCAEEYPVQFLVAAHIKKRAACSHDEKRDFEHVVTPMCRFGCDELYERGYVVVLDGTIQAVDHHPVSASLEQYRNKLVGRQTPAWRRESAPYFDWHRSQHERR